jgi:hypothetical protein
MHKYLSFNKYMLTCERTTIYIYIHEKYGLTNIPAIKINFTALITNGVFGR